MVCVAKTYFFFSKKENNIRRIKKAVSLQSEDRVPPSHLTIILITKTYKHYGKIYQLLHQFRPQAHIRQGNG